MKKFEIALEKVIKQFGKKIITEKRFVSVLADYNAFYDTPAIRDIVVICINDGFTQDLYSICSRKSIFGGNEKKFKDVRECVTRYKGSIKSGRNKKFSEEVIDLIVSRIFEGYNSSSYKNTQRNNIQTKNKTRFHLRNRYLLGVLLALFLCYGYCLNQAVQHNTEIENERQTKDVTLSFKGFVLGNNIDEEYDKKRHGWDIHIENGIHYEIDWYNHERIDFHDCEYFTFKTDLSREYVYVTIKAFRKELYEIEIDRNEVEDIEKDYIKKYGEPSIDKFSLGLSFLNIKPYMMEWKYKNGTITITHSKIRYYLPKTLKLVETYKKEKEEEARRKVLQREREDSIMEALKAKEREKREREEKIKQLNDI